MLDIGRLSPGAADYYLGEVASSAEEYYTGRGESEGRWVGALAESVGLRGSVSGPAFRAVLEGRHPVTSEQVVRRPRHRAPEARVNRHQLNLIKEEEYDLPRVAARLHLGVRRVRQLIWTGDRKQDVPDGYLVARRGRSTGGRPPWLVARSEVERFEAAKELRKGRPGFDLTLRPPKSVSVLWALGTPDVRDAVRQAHSDAVDVVVDYIEAHALYGRKRSESGQDPIETDGLIGAAFDHRTSRAGDPLLHTHVVIANLTRSVEGKWQALDARPLYAHARTAGVLYKAHLRYLLTKRLGVRWEEVRNGWAEIAGIPRDVLRAFSKRRDEIEEVVAESGYTSARAHQAATLATRQPKKYGISPDTLMQQWREEALALGFGPEDVQACLHHGTQPKSDALDQSFAFLAGPEGLTKHSSTFTRKEVVEALAECAGITTDAPAINEAADRFLATASVQSLFPAKGAKEWVWRRSSKERDVDLISWSTPDLLAMEHDLLRWATEGFAGHLRVPGADTIEAALASKPSLSAEQRAMVRALASHDAPSIQTVAGRPGSGKTSATAVYVEALAASGLPVVGCAVAATAAGELERACDLRAWTGREASTLARLLVELEVRPLEQGAVVILDEASMVGTRDLHRIASHVAAANGALKLIGDPDQHGAVETGGAFRALVGREANGIRLVENNRQLDSDDREAIDHFREGNVEAALSRYDDQGRIVRSPNSKDSYRRIVDDWWTSVADGGRDPMIAGTNAVRRRLNALARARMASEGSLTGDEVDNADGTKLASGDWVVARRNNRRLQSPSGAWVKNGSAGRVVATDLRRATITVAFDREGEIRLPRWYLEGGFVEHAYARTTFGVQGATLERAFVHVDDRTGFEEGYVALTRGRRNTTIYLVDGTVDTANDDVGHRAHEQQDTGLDTVAKAMRERRAGSLAHEQDARAADSTVRFNGCGLAELHTRRRALEHVLAHGPKDVEQELRRAVVERDGIITRLKARANARSGAKETGRVARALRKVDQRIARLREQHDDRLRFLQENEDVVGELEVLRRAELDREARIRSETRASYQSSMATRPSFGSAARAEIAAAELGALHIERFGRIDIDARDETEQVLGAKPAKGVEARLSYERASDALRSALRLRELEPAPTIAADPEPPSLFD